MATNKSKQAGFVIVRKARKGRTVSPETLAARATLDKRWANKSDRQTVTVKDEGGAVVETFDALILKPADLGKPVTFTGTVGLVSRWAKDNGHQIRTHDLGDHTYAIRAKG